MIDPPLGIPTHRLLHNIEIERYKLGLDSRINSFFLAHTVSNWQGKGGLNNSLETLVFFWIFILLFHNFPCMVLVVWG